MKEVDKTIDAICNYIQKMLKSEVDNTNHNVSEMVSALAELVSARTALSVDIDPVKLVCNELKKEMNMEDTDYSF